jgi:hypothetical protein
MKFTLEHYRPHVWLILFKSQYMCASTMMRMQEFYESPYKEIQGQVFSLEKFMDVYAERQEHGMFSYFTDWGGFNLPGHVLNEFAKRYNTMMLRKEQVMIDSLFKMIGKTGIPYYVVSTHEELSPAKLQANIAHEIAHAYWYLHSEDYKAVMEDHLRELEATQPKFFKIVYDALLNMGYCEQVVFDEMQAYFATSTPSQLIDIFNLKGKRNFKLPSIFKRYYLKFDAVQQNQILTYELGEKNI